MICVAQGRHTIEFFNSTIILLPITVDTAFLEEKTEEDGCGEAAS